MSWNPPPVVVLSGGEGLLRKRQLQKAISASNSSGRVVEYATGKDTDKISEVISSSTGMFFTTKYLLVVDDPEKVDPDLILEHHERGDNSTAIVLNMDGDIKVRSPLGKIVKKLPSKWVDPFKYPLPKPWKKMEVATQFAFNEATRCGVKISQQLVVAMVDAVGTDLGVLAFEIEKAALLAQSQGTDIITPEMLRQTLAPYAETDVLSVVDAVGMRNPKLLGKSLSQVRRTTGGAKSGIVMRVIGLLMVNVVKWLHVKCLVDQGKKPSQISTQTGLSDYILTKKIFPVIRKWDQSSLIELLESLTGVERGIRSGWIDPWTVFEAKLFAAISGSS